MKRLYLTLLIALTGACGMVLAQKLVFVNIQTVPVELVVVRKNPTRLGYTFPLPVDQGQIVTLKRLEDEQFTHIGFLPKTGALRAEADKALKPYYTSLYGSAAPYYYDRDLGLLPETNEHFKAAIEFLSQNPEKNLEIVFESDGTISLKEMEKK